MLQYTSIGIYYHNKTNKNERKRDENYGRLYGMEYHAISHSQAVQGRRFYIVAVHRLRLLLWFESVGFTQTNMAMLLEGDRFTINEQKTGKRRVIKINNDFQDHIRKCYSSEN